MSKSKIYGKPSKVLSVLMAAIDGQNLPLVLYYGKVVCSVSTNKGCPRFPMSSPLHQTSMLSHAHPKNNLHQPEWAQSGYSVSGGGL